MTHDTPTDGSPLPWYQQLFLIVLVVVICVFVAASVFHVVLKWPMEALGLWQSVERPKMIQCVEYRTMREELFTRELRCERWSDGKTREDLKLDQPGGAGSK